MINLNHMIDIMCEMDTQLMSERFVLHQPLSSCMLRTRISAIKAECAKHEGWIRLLSSSIHV